MSKTILIIDDDDLICNLSRIALEQGGYTVITASDGKTGVEKYRTEKPDLVVLDIAMPEMSGFEVTTQIRAIQKNEGRSRTPIVILTAYARSFFMSVGSEAGIDSYLTKPIEPRKLLEHVNQFIGDQSAKNTNGTNQPVKNTDETDQPVKSTSETDQPAPGQS